MSSLSYSYSTENILALFYIVTHLNLNYKPKNLIKMRPDVFQNSDFLKSGIVHICFIVSPTFLDRVWGSTCNQILYVFSKTFEWVYHMGSVLLQFRSILRANESAINLRRKLQFTELWISPWSVRDSTSEVPVRSTL